MFKKKYWFVIGIYLLMQLFSAIIPVFIIVMFGSDPVKMTVYTNIILFILALVAIVWLMWSDVREERLAHSLSPGQFVGWIAFGLLLAWIAELLAASILMNILGVSENSANTEAIVEISRLNPIFIIIPAIVGPILEELIFRKIIFGYFYEKFGFLIAGFISAVIFGLAHMEIQLLLIYVAMGLVFAYLYMKTKRIIVPMLVHMLLNSIAVIGQLVIGPEKLQQMQDQAMTILMFH